MTSQTVGQYGHPSGADCEYLTMAFSPLSAPLRSRWRNNGLSADFLGDYVLTFLPASGSLAATESRQKEIRQAVTYIANELLENAMKYHEPLVNIPIGIHLELTSEHITVSAGNGIGFLQAAAYKAFVEDILREDAADLFVRQVEDSLKSKESNRSGLGLLTMINDYGAQLGCRFEVHPEYSEMMTVTTSVVLKLKDFPGALA
jgi:hypothetical protein